MLSRLQASENPKFSQIALTVVENPEIPADHTDNENIGKNNIEQPNNHQHTANTGSSTAQDKPHAAQNSTGTQNSTNAQDNSQNKYGIHELSATGVNIAVLVSAVAIIAVVVISLLAIQKNSSRK